MAMTHRRSYRNHSAFAAMAVILAASFAASAVAACVAAA
eukprot:CAMPEP_0172824702 /NCGR_PEP_ID=MMETSP1075-20121228/18178_1 /TAXON_ID=2916 /ORGANISM="Ceratium fusus, Strain PA161109" /LENGTH=38 /DNA_ID= /DNA_START= /DNA_END= /DNA_ORIENTATION=